MYLPHEFSGLFIYSAPVDCRMGHNKLTGLVVEQLNRDPIDKGIFLFVSRNRKTAKVLFWDGSGMVILHKKMEKGKIMEFSRSHKMIESEISDLRLLLGGGHIVYDLRLK